MQNTTPDTSNKDKNPPSSGTLRQEFDFEDNEGLDALGELELNELDSVVNFADNVAYELATKTQKKLNQLT